MDAPLQSPDCEVLCERLVTEMQRDSTVTFESICGYDNIKDDLKLYLHKVTTRSELCVQLLPQPLLLYGHPGIGKTMLVNAAAHSASMRVFVFNVYTLGSMVCNRQVSGVIKKVFQVVQQNSPIVLCFEDIERVSKDGAVEEEFLVELHNHIKFHGENLSMSVAVIGITQKPWLCSNALRDKFRKLYVDLPNKTDIIHILKHHLEQANHCLTAEDFLELGEKMLGFSGADVVCVFRDVCMNEIRKLQKAKYFRKIHTVLDSDIMGGEPKASNLNNMGGIICTDAPTDSITESRTDYETLNAPGFCYAPCEETDEGAERLTLTDIDINLLAPHTITMSDFTQCLQQTRPSIVHVQAQSFFPLYCVEQFRRSKCHYNALQQA